jgi:hypothetical protein
MKRLLILTAAAMFAAGAAGCGHLFNRGSACNTYPAAAPVMADPCMGAPAAYTEGGVLPGPAVTYPAP